MIKHCDRVVYRLIISDSIEETSDLLRDNQRPEVEQKTI